MTGTKKLIEVALPLEAINVASAREKSIRHGHPSTLHLWWARRPLAAARAVIFAQMVDDPSAHPDRFPTERDQARERQRLFGIIEELVKWENTTDEEVLSQARAEIFRCCGLPETDDLRRLEEISLDVIAPMFGYDYDPEGGQAVLHYRETGELPADLLTLMKAFVYLQRYRRSQGQSDLLVPEDDQEFRAVYRVLRERFNEDRPGLPAFHDPFAGGGSLPLEAQRLGLEAYASDLNPVAVLINKAMIEIPPKFAGRPPVNPEWQRKSAAEKATYEWRGAQGLAEDVRYYGKWMRDEAEKRIGHLYPKIAITQEMVAERSDLRANLGQKLTVIAWIWARTVKSPNPAFANVDVPLASTFMLSTKAGKEAYVEPVIEGDGYRFTVKVGKPRDPERARNGTKLSRGANFECLMSGTPIAGDYIRAEAKAGRMGARLMAIVAEGGRGRVYLPPTPEHAAAAQRAMPEWKPDLTVTTPCHDVDRLPMYGMPTWGDAFTPRQQTALTTLCELVAGAAERSREHAMTAGCADESKPLAEGGCGAAAYGQAIGVYLACAIGKAADYNSMVCSWISGGQTMRNTFGRQAIPMVWDFAEANTLSNLTGSFASGVEQVQRVTRELPTAPMGYVQQFDAQSQLLSTDKLVSTDPPYYDNVGYADLSDYFYVWMRRSLRATYPDLFATVAVPKSEELVAAHHRHGSKQQAEEFFLEGMTSAMHRLAERSHSEFPVTIYYAFKQAESQDDSGTASTGWEAFLAGVICAGFGISGTWPMRTELANKVSGIGNNMLASSIVLVCRRRPDDAPTATRREFVAALQRELPSALRHLQAGNIAPVDLAQAAIGPGMAVFTRYAKVLDAEGQPVSVRQALALINETLDTALAEQEGDFDGDTRWALAWFEQFGFDEGEFGVAETLSKAKNTSVEGMVQAGIVAAGSGKVRLLKPDELPADWDPTKDKRLTVWETVHHLVRVLEAGGEGATAELAAKLGSAAETARELAYRLYTLCERKKRAAEALSYNALVQSWPEVSRLAQTTRPAPGAVQQSLFEGE